MADSYLTISIVANDGFMLGRVTACAAQQQQVGNGVITDAPVWALQNRWAWAASPSWGEKWDYAVNTHPPVEGEAPYQPGSDPAVITDGDILATVQALAT